MTRSGRPTIAVAGGKGGCGKTTTTLALARTLPEPTLAVDGDWDLPNLHALAGLPRDPDSSEGGSGPGPGTGPGPESEPGTRRSRMQDANRGVEGATDGSGARVVPAPAAPGIVDPRRWFTRLSERTAATTLIDCPAGAGPDAAAPLAVADRTLLVSTLSPPALRDTMKTAAMARRLGAPPIGVVVTRTRDVPEGAAELFDAPVLGAVPAVPPPVVSDPRVLEAYGSVALALGDAPRRASSTGAAGADSDGSPTDDASADDGERTHGGRTPRTGRVSPISN